MLTDFHIKQHDTRPVIAMTLKRRDRDGNLVTIDDDLTGATVEFHMETQAKAVLVTAGVGSVLNTDTKEIGYVWQPGDTDTPSYQDDGSGSLDDTPHLAEFQVTYSDGGIETFPNDSDILVHIYPDVP